MVSKKMLCIGNLETRKLVPDAIEALLRKCRYRGAEATDVFHVYTN
jgi:hypothetical protein